MQAEMFIASAQGRGRGLLCPARARGSVPRIEAAVDATWAVAGCNTNLGILLLCAPIATSGGAAVTMPWRRQPCESRHRGDVLADLDTGAMLQAAYRAIARSPTPVDWARLTEPRRAVNRRVSTCAPQWRWLAQRDSIALPVPRRLCRICSSFGLTALGQRVFTHDRRGQAQSAGHPIQPAPSQRCSALYLALLSTLCPIHTLFGFMARPPRTHCHALQAQRLARTRGARCCVNLDAEPGIQVAWDDSHSRLDRHQPRYHGGYERWRRC